MPIENILRLLLLIELSSIWTKKKKKLKEKEN
jgi:hypothetical protein